ncbi:MAG: DUF2769 domain-containing protein, partial [Candidatus Aminicenantales bacterium]
CKKKGEEAPEEAAQVQAQGPAQESPAEKMTRKDMVKKMLMDKKGLSAEEADAQIAEFEKMLPMVQEKCICKTCPTYIANETKVGFCQPLVGKSGVITEEKGCNCPQCPIYKEKGLKNGYYCTRGSEMEQEMAKMG